jgi:hypothetical protein
MKNHKFEQSMKDKNKLATTAVTSTTGMNHHLDVVSEDRSKITDISNTQNHIRKNFSYSKSSMMNSSLYPQSRSTRGTNNYLGSRVMNASSYSSPNRDSSIYKKLKEGKYSYEQTK